jgi:hypothetical protein
MRKIFKIITLILLITSPFNISAQEIVSGLLGNPVAEKYYSDQPITRKATIPADTVELPFIDDFSDSKVEPKKSLWSDKYAFINTTYAINPPTVGVATLDALNYNGSQYPGAGPIPYQADYLTSQPINLNYPSSENIFLSFYYEPGGLGEPPEKSDSLILDFYAPGNRSWKKIWSVPGIDSHEEIKIFNRVMIGIEDTSFLQKGFRFRFRNYASQFPNTDLADKRANVDLWHIDYVKLDKNRFASDTVLHDVAFTEPVKSILKDYTSIPWPHFESAYNTQRAPYIEVIIKNHDNVSRNVGTILEIRDLIKPKSVYKVPAYYTDIISGDSILYKFSYNYPFDFSYPDSGAFEIKTILQTDFFDFKPNDTLRYIQKFYDYYALDDGTAEASYGLRGSGTKDASSALKFNSFVGDSLRAVDIYFVQLVDSLNLGYYFYLNVWNDNNGKPGTALVNQVGMRPVYSDKINQFHRYSLDSPVYIKGTFYIGFTQTVEKLLNVGLDLNRSNMPKIFNNIKNGVWEATTKLPGTPMMRPVFKQDALLGTKFPSIPLVTAWPNPANDFINISFDEAYSNSALSRVELIDISGRIMRSINPESERIISTGDLQNGMYFLRMTDSASKKSSTKKIIISH